MFVHACASSSCFPAVIQLLNIVQQVIPQVCLKHRLQNNSYNPNMSFLKRSSPAPTLTTDGRWHLNRAAAVPLIAFLHLSWWFSVCLCHTAIVWWPSGLKWCQAIWAAPKLKRQGMKKRKKKKPYWWMVEIKWGKKNRKQSRWKLKELP